ncbi:MAG: RIP metalloprotease RseP [Lachnospiraceae bacterium]|nr:RIP metalloprotease RseP [Lachnospiraceae bacterium]
MSIVIALIIFSVLVVFHEFGHFIIAKKNKIVVNEFSLGMGPRIISWGKGETKYSIKALPFGGSCAMLGEDQDTVVEGSFNSKSVWARMAVVFAGPFFNFILAWILAIIVIGFQGADLAYVTDMEKGSLLYEKGLRDGDKLIRFNGNSAILARELFRDSYFENLDGGEIELVYKREGKKQTIKYKPEGEEKYFVGMSYSATSNPANIIVIKGSALEEAGVLSDDEIIKINDVEISSGKELYEYLEENPWQNEEYRITVKRKNKTLTMKFRPKMTMVYDKGFSFTGKRVKQSPVGVIRYSFTEVKYEIVTVVKSLKMLVTGKVKKNEMSGPIGIVNAIGDTYKETRKESVMITVMTMLNMAIMLSANLGVMNLLPLPALDGGRLVFFIIEAIRRKPIDREKEGLVHLIGFALLMVLMMFLILNDIGKLL